MAKGRRWSPGSPTPAPASSPCPSSVTVTVGGSHRASPLPTAHAACASSRHGPMPTATVLLFLQSQARSHLPGLCFLCRWFPLSVPAGVCCSAVAHSPPAFTGIIIITIIEVELVTMLLVSVLGRSDAAVHLHVCTYIAFYSCHCCFITGERIQSLVLHSWSVLYTARASVNPKRLPYPSPSPSGNHAFVFCVRESVSVNKFICVVSKCTCK